MKIGLNARGKFYGLTLSFGGGGAALPASNDFGLAGLPVGTPSVDQAMRVTACYASVGILAGNIASLPKYVVERDGSTEKRLEEHPANILMEFPNPEFDGYQFWEKIGEHTFTLGNGLAYVEKDSNGMPRKIVPFHQSQIEKIERLGSDKNYKVIVAKEPQNPHGSTIRLDLPGRDVIHIAGPGGTAYGLAPSPIEVAAQSALKIGRISQEQYLDSLNNGSRFSSTLTPPPEMKVDAWNTIKDAWQKNYSGGKHAGQTVLLPPGVKFNTAQFSPAEMQMMESLNMTVEDISRVWGVPLFMLSRQETASWAGANVQVHWTNFVRSALRRHIARYEAALTHALIKNPRGNKYRVKIDPTPLLRATRQEIVDDATAMFSGGLIKRDEARAEVGYEPIGGDAGSEVMAPAGTPSRRSTGKNQPATPNKGDK